MWSTNIWAYWPNRDKRIKGVSIAICFFSGGLKFEVAHFVRKPQPAPEVSRKFARGCEQRLPGADQRGLAAGLACQCIPYRGIADHEALPVSGDAHAGIAVCITLGADLFQQVLSLFLPGCFSGKPRRQHVQYSALHRVELHTTQCSSVIAPLYTGYSSSGPLRLFANSQRV